MKRGITESVLCASGAIARCRSRNHTRYDVSDLLQGGRRSRFPYFQFLTPAARVSPNREAYADAYAVAKPSRVLVARCNTWHTQAIAPMAENIGEVAYNRPTARATRAANRQAIDKTLDAAKGNGGRAPFSLISETANERNQKMNKTQKLILAAWAFTALAMTACAAYTLAHDEPNPNALAEYEIAFLSGGRD